MDPDFSMHLAYGRRKHLLLVICLVFFIATFHEFQLDTFPTIHELSFTLFFTASPTCNLGLKGFRFVGYIVFEILHVDTVQYDRVFNNSNNRLPQGTYAIALILRFLSREEIIF